MSRKRAETAWKRLTEEQQCAAVEALPRHIRYWEAKGTSKEFIPYPATWLNGFSWEDELDFAEAIPAKALAWWATDKGVIERGRESGIFARPGETMAELKARVIEAARQAA